MAGDIVDRLKAAEAERHKRFANALVDRDVLLEAAAEIRRLRSQGERAAVVAALAPFAAVADIYHDSDDDSHPVWVDATEREVKALTVGACRRARAVIRALSSPPPSERGEGT